MWFDLGGDASLVVGVVMVRVVTKYDSTRPNPIVISKEMTIAMSKGMTIAISNRIVIAMSSQRVNGLILIKILYQVRAGFQQQPR